jgi:hypothetical protein
MQIAFLVDSRAGVGLGVAAQRRHTVHGKQSRLTPARS